MRLLEARGRYWRTPKGGRLYVYIPSKVGSDSQCPLVGEKGNVTVRIEKGRIIIEKTA